ncbi:unnamed protein product [Linum tenue]|uniref:Uncharacterized protein n=1 Tax=Linum tenue TaxID=586396 RepID=A0AAV0MK55_9ROSI|nr:unnamed protein product [Linum tenue]
MSLASASKIETFSHVFQSHEEPVERPQRKLQAFQFGFLLLEFILLQQFSYHKLPRFPRLPIPNQSFTRQYLLSDPTLDSQSDPTLDSQSDPTQEEK